MIKCFINNKVYIGKSKTIHKRIQRHKTDLKCERHKNVHLQRAYNLYGVENFDYSIIEICIENDLFIREDYWANYYNSNDKKFGFNIRPTDIKNKAGHSDETKEKIRKANLGLKHPEWRNKIKSIAQGGEKHWTKNKKFSEDSKIKMSESQKNLYKNGYKHPNAKSIIQYTLDDIFIKEWKSATQIEKEIGLCRRTIGKHLINNIEICFNYKWKYKDENEKK